MEPDRVNSPTTFEMSLEVFGHELQFSQDPNSKHLGTTVWDASLVFVKFLEKNCRRGRFSPSKLKGKRVLELGAGCGVAGFGMALLGCNVIATDQKEVLPLLKRNVERNTSRVMQMNPGANSFGSIKVAELLWGNKNHIKAVDPPFDYIIGTDVVYTEHLLEPLLETIFALSGPKTTILLGYEIRSTSVHELMLEMWKRNFDVKTIAKSKMDEVYQHPSIQLFILGSKPTADSSQVTNQTPTMKVDEVPDGEEGDQVGENNEAKGDEKEVSIVQGKVEEDSKLVTSLGSRKLNDWDARRYGSMAARILRDVKLS